MALWQYLTSNNLNHFGASINIAIFNVTNMCKKTWKVYFFTTSECSWLDFLNIQCQHLTCKVHISSWILQNMFVCHRTATLKLQKQLKSGLFIYFNCLINKTTKCFNSEIPHSLTVMFILLKCQVVITKHLFFF